MEGSGRVRLGVGWLKAVRVVAASFSKREMESLGDPPPKKTTQNHIV